MNKTLSLPALKAGEVAFLCILSYLSPSGGKSALGNMPPSSVSGCCFASAVAYLL